MIKVRLTRGGTRKGEERTTRIVVPWVEGDAVAMATRGCSGGGRLMQGAAPPQVRRSALTSM